MYMWHSMSCMGQERLGNDENVPAFPLVMGLQLKGLFPSELIRHASLESGEKCFYRFFLTSKSFPLSCILTDKTTFIKVFYEMELHAHIKKHDTVLYIMLCKHQNK